MKHNGIPTEDSYGNYLGIDGFCHVDDPSTKMGLQVMIKINIGFGIEKYSGVSIRLIRII